MSTIKERVQDLCRQNGLSAAEFERLMGFGAGYVTKLDKSVPSSKKLKAIADYFQVSVSYILNGKEAEARDETDGGYYFDKRTAEMAQTLYENRALSLLFDEARDASPDDLLVTYSVLKALKDKEKRTGD